MELNEMANEILRQLIRNRFDALNTASLFTEGLMLIDIARQAGFHEMALEMECDMRFSLPGGMTERLIAA